MDHPFVQKITAIKMQTLKNKVAMVFAGKGGELSPSDYYFRTSVSFETGSQKYGLC